MEEGDGGATVALHTPAAWVCRAAAGWKKDVSRLTIQLGFQEHFDAGEDPAECAARELVGPLSSGR